MKLHAPYLRNKSMSRVWKLTEGNIQALVLCREKARGDKDWDQADRIRDYLQAKGVTVMDRPGKPSAAVYYPEELGKEV